MERQPHVIREAKPHDLEDLQAIEQSSFQSDRLSRKQMTRLMAAPTCRFTLEEGGGKVRGMAVLTFRAGGRSARVLSLVTDSRHRGAGVAGALLNQAERWSRKEGFERLTLEVRQDNAAAIAYYEKRGFRRLGEAPNYYEDGEAAFRYEKTLEHLHRCPSTLHHLHELSEYEPAPTGRTDTSVSGAILQQAIGAIMTRVTLDREHDIPYLAGYSKDGKTIFIDRHVPPTFQYGGRTVHVDPFLILHEAVEKTLIDALGLAYQHAHQIATRAEQALVRSNGVSWAEYDRFMQRYIKDAGDEQLTRLPKDLDFKPYRDEEDLELLQRMVAAIAPSPAKKPKVAKKGNVASKRRS